MSKFFRQDSSESSSSSESEAEEVQVQVPTKKVPIARDFAFPSDDEEDEKRVVVSHKDRKFDELKTIVRNIRNARNTKDMTKMLSGFADLNTAYDRSKTVFARQNIQCPQFFIRILVELEDYVNNLWDDKDARGALSKLNSKALSNLRQRLRKYMKDFESKADEYRQKPDPLGYETPEDLEENEEAPIDDDDLPEVPTKTAGKGKYAVSSEDESDSDWSSSSGPSDTESDSEMDDEAKKMESLRRYFLKKEFRHGEKPEKAKKAQREKQVVQKPSAIVPSDEESDEEGWTTPKEKQVQLFAPDQEVTLEAMIEKLDEVLSSRGRVGTNRKHHLRLLQELYTIAEQKNLGIAVLVKLLFSIISSLFELNAKISDFMEFSNFTKTLAAVNQLLDMLEENTNVILSVKYTDEDENLKDETKPFQVQGSLLMTVQRLDSELTKILQNADCHSNDYIEKLKGEKDMCTLIERTEKYVEDRLSMNIFDNDEVCKVYMMRIEHLYFKYQEHHEGSEAPGVIMDRLCKKIYARDDEKRLRQRAMLCHIYFLALHDEWHRARDLILMSHLQAIVDHSDIDTQILYNRAICQLGLCAFRHGFIREAHQGLSEIQNTQRAKELLAQALAMRQMERTAEQEKLERQRQVPYHMHVNVELMECVYLICSMLLEIPHMASCEFEMRRRLLSRSFHYQLKQNEKSSLVGPPENTREHVVAASRAMLAGDWRKCRDYIVNDKMNQKVWNLFRNSEAVKQMVVSRIQEESLRTYLLMYSTVYATVSLQKLATLFELDQKQVHSVISKMIIQEELSATLDEPTGCLIMHRVEPSRLQMMALNLTDKLQQLAENNEQILEPRTGRAGYSGSGVWFPTRDRQGEKQKGVGSFQGRAGAGGDGKRNVAWGAQPSAAHRRDRNVQKRF